LHVHAVDFSAQLQSLLAITNGLQTQTKKEVEKSV
jgi:hypothetical protein